MLQRLKNTHICLAFQKRPVCHNQTTHEAKWGSLERQIISQAKCCLIQETVVKDLLPPHRGDDVDFRAKQLFEGKVGVEVDVSFVTAGLEHILILFDFHGKITNYWLRSVLSIME